MGIALLFVYEVIQNKVKYFLSLKYFLSPKTFNMYYKVSFYAYGHKTKRFPCGIKMSCPVELVVSKLQHMSCFNTHLCYFSPKIDLKSQSFEIRGTQILIFHLLIDLQSGCSSQGWQAKSKSPPVQGASVASGHFVPVLCQSLLLILHMSHPAHFLESWDKSRIHR